MPFTAASIYPSKQPQTISQGVCPLPPTHTPPTQKEQNHPSLQPQDTHHLVTNTHIYTHTHYKPQTLTSNKPHKDNNNQQHSHKTNKQARQNKQKKQ
jgi:hypothetical protein